MCDSVMWLIMPDCTNECGLAIPPRHPLNRSSLRRTRAASIRPDQKRIAAKSWHKVLGELRSMVLAIPGGKGLFSTLQEAFRHPTDGGRLKLTKNVHAFLADFRWLANI